VQKHRDDLEKVEFTLQHRPYGWLGFVVGALGIPIGAAAAIVLPHYIYLPMPYEMFWLTLPILGMVPGVYLARFRRQLEVKLSRARLQISGWREEHDLLLGPFEMSWERHMVRSEPMWKVRLVLGDETVAIAQVQCAEVELIQIRDAIQDQIDRTGSAQGVDEATARDLARLAQLAKSVHSQEG